MKGIIYEIQRFSLYDGPGIRTTVFLKGCPLRCVWCSNPESWKPEVQIAFLPEKCIRCGACFDTCHQGAIKEINNTVRLDFTACNACGNCVNACAFGALRTYGYEVEAKHLMETLVRDSEYYQESGGGVTMSGGEPMDQPEFTAEVLQLCKENGIHTAIETSGYAPSESFQMLINVTDLFLFDYKHSDAFLHRRYTRKDQDIILKNLELLIAYKAKVRLRCPIIPGINNTEEHFRNIIALSKKYPELEGVEIMPYHNLGMAKYGQIGLTPFPVESGSVSSLLASEWEKKLLEAGCLNLLRKYYKN